MAEQYLCGFVNYFQDDWEDWLPLAKFVENNAASETTNMWLLFVNYDFDPRVRTDLVSVSPDEDRRGKTVAQALRDIYEGAWNEIFHAEDKQRESDNRSQQSPPDFQKWQKVLLDARNISTQRL